MRQNEGGNGDFGALSSLELSHIPVVNPVEATVPMESLIVSLHTEQLPGRIRFG
jgi:hypothetical protein